MIAAPQVTIVQLGMVGKHMKVEKLNKRWAIVVGKGWEEVKTQSVAVEFSMVAFERLGRNELGEMKRSGEHVVPSRKGKSTCEDLHL